MIIAKDMKNRGADGDGTGLAESRSLIAAFRLAFWLALDLAAGLVVVFPLARFFPGSSVGTACRPHPDRRPVRDRSDMTILGWDEGIASSRQRDIGFERPEGRSTSALVAHSPKSVRTGLAKGEIFHIPGAMNSSQAVFRGRRQR